MSRLKLSLLSLCVMALSLMAFAASSASAAEWLILNSKGEVKTAKELPAEVAGELEKDVTLLTNLIGLKVSVLCTKVALAGTKLEGGGKLTVGFKLTYTGCTVTAPLECTVRSPGSAAGTVVTRELLGLLQPNGEVLIEAKTAGGPLAELLFEGLGCALPTGVVEPINGVVWVKDCQGKVETHLIKHLIEESTAHGHTMWIEKHKVDHLETLIEGSALVFLAGAHAGLAWGATLP